MSELPNGWVDVRLSDISRRVTDGTHLPPKFVDTGIPFIVIGNVIRGQIDWSGVSKWVTAETYEQFTARCRPERGDVLYTAVGSYGVAVPVEDDRCFMFQRHIAHIKPCSDVADTKFLVFVLNSPQVKSVADQVARGVAQKTVTLGDLKDFQIPLPPIAEQRRIVAKIEALTAKSRRAKEALDAIPALLERFRQSVLAAAFRGDLTADWREKNPDVEPAEELLKRIRAERRRRWEEAELAKMRAKGKVPGDDRWKEKYQEPAPVDASELPDLPDGWCWASHEELLRFVTSGSRGWAEYYADAGPLFIRIGNLEHHTIELDLRDKQCVKPPPGAEGSRTRVQPGDILISITADLGMIGLVRDELGEAYVNQHVALARLVMPQLSEYLAYFLAAPSAGKRQLLAENRGMTKAGLGLEDILSVRVALPPLQEQIEIVRQVADVQSRLSRLSRIRADSCRDLLALDRANLAKAFRGELVPQDPNDEPASVLLERLRAERAQNGKPTNGASRRRAAASPPPAASNPAAKGGKPRASRRSEAPARSRG